MGLAKAELAGLRATHWRVLSSRRKQDGTLKRIYERYFGHVNQLDSTDILGIQQRRPQRLPELRRYFREAQTLTGIDWRLLAAIGYQESQWDPLATSPTGVRGLMMLTGDTADRLGVSNRLDARQSILGGARYLALLKETLPERIPEPDRTWLALAAYNQGQGHLEDARRIAQAQGGNPDSWADVKEALPHLGRRQVCQANEIRLRARRRGAAVCRKHPQLLRHPAATGARNTSPLFNLGRSIDRTGGARLTRYSGAQAAVSRSSPPM